MISIRLLITIALSVGLVTYIVSSLYQPTKAIADEPATVMTIAKTPEGCTLYEIINRNFQGDRYSHYALICPAAYNGSDLR